MIQRPNYNPDVLTCLANLSNDEVFTPPQVVNQMLDMLPQELFRSKETKFLDPVSKSGVFLREIAKRLMKGLEKEIPDIYERADHILSNQLYGIAITELTALTSRRSLYCSKYANGQYSICRKFKTEEGNLRFNAIEHKFVDGKCKYCGASESVFGKKVRTELESHAYEFIHTDKPEKIFGNMKFDVIIGNPPYQLNTAGEENGAQAKPLYHIFVQQAIKLNSRYVVMITPSRWFAGGWGLDDFRNMMLTCNHIRELHDFQNSSDCFIGVDIKGGVSYFLFENKYDGPCEFVSHSNDTIVSSKKRFLKTEGCDTLIRYNESLGILDKVRSFSEHTFEELVSTKKPFGMTTNYHGKPEPFNNSIKLYGNKRIEYITQKEVTRNAKFVNSHKLIVPKAVGSGDGKTDVIKPIYCEPQSVCTETYLLVGPFENKQMCENVCTYIDTKFFHFLVTLLKNTQDCMKKVYSFVPLQDFSHPWTDEMLYKKYGLTEEEIAFIESMIRPME